MSDLISRADAIGAVHEYYQKRFTEDSKWDADVKMFVLEDKTIAKDNMEICNIINALPSAEQVTSKLNNPCDSLLIDDKDGSKEQKSKLESADAEPKWSCTANFVAEQLDRLRNMTDEEKWEFFRKFFGMGDAVHGEWEHWGSPFSDESEVIDTIVCSVCGARFIEPKDEPKGEYNYCPSCGARMKGGDTE